MNDQNDANRVEERKRKAANDKTPVAFLCKDPACHVFGHTVFRRTRGHGTCLKCHKYNKL